MNNLSHFDRSKILFNSDFTNILFPPSLYLQKNKTFVDITQEEDKSNLILNNKNNNLNSYTTKNSKGINLMFDYKNNINKKKKSNHFYNYTNQQSPNKLNPNNKKMNKFEENKNEIIYNFKKVNPSKTAGRFSETNHISNKLSNNIMTKFYTYNKMFVKKRQNLSINFNLNSPTTNNNMNKNNNGGRNKKLNKQIRNVSNSNMKYQSYANINELNNNYQNETNFEYRRFTSANDKKRIKEIYDRNSQYFNVPMSSNIYLSTENNINSRNITTKKLSNLHNKNYNLINISYSTERNNTYSNLNSYKMQNDNEIKRQIKNNKNQYKNIKYSFKTKDAYICKENKIDKKSLQQYYDQEFNDENDQNAMNVEKRDYKFNNEDLNYKECLSTNHSTCTNEINKVNGNEIRKRISNQKPFMSRNSPNPEMFHFYMVSYLQKGKKLGNIFN